MTDSRIGWDKSNFYENLSYCDYPIYVGLGDKYDAKAGPGIVAGSRKQGHAQWVSEEEFLRSWSYF